ncbi:acyl-CoA dehydrogenase family protein [Aquibium sp. LZ166]|uniref:Acyl-CoA dehydrogenase family protein n=1 Tax=Aquibium pacificus TaxID=3153579 RepID=A0ABV3SMT2_9HYPH
MAVDMAERLFAGLFWPDGVRAADADWRTQAWDAIEETGLTLALVPEDAGGFGLDLREALDLVRVAGGAAVPLPFAETLVANWLLAKSGLFLPGGALALAISATPPRLAAEGGGLRLSGRVPRVPWGRSARHAVVPAELDGELRLVLVPKDAFEIAGELTNLAGEPRDTLAFDLIVPSANLARLPADLELQDLLGCAAAIRAIAIAGALETVLQRSVTYAMERVQFGRPIGKFQAIQHQLAVMAGHGAMASAAAQLAADAFGDLRQRNRIASAKVVADEAAGTSAAIAHQVHGAIGFAREHPLHALTLRLWSWRDEYGGASVWGLDLGRSAIKAGREGLWPLVVG